MLQHLSQEPRGVGSSGEPEKEDVVSWSVVSHQKLDDYVKRLFSKLCIRSVKPENGRPTL
jgi:hypothetical protein